MLSGCPLLCRQVWHVRGLPVVVSQVATIPAPTYYLLQCKRRVFESDGVLPEVGEIVVCLQSAGPSKGQQLVCHKVHKDGWKQAGELGDGGRM